MKINLPVSQREKVYGDEIIITSLTDLKGAITYANRDFIEISGFPEEELIGKNHNVVRHPDMPPIAFKDLWDTIKRGQSWRGVVKNRCKNGDHYWVDAYVTPVYSGDEIVAYQSVRTRPSREQIEAADRLYARLRADDKAQLPKKFKIFDLSLKLRLRFALLTLAALAIIVALISGYTASEQQGVLAAHVDQIGEVQRLWTASHGDSDGELGDKIAALSADASGQPLQTAFAGARQLGAYFIIAVCLLGLLIMIATDMLLNRTLIAPLSQVVDLAKGMASGTLIQRVEVPHNDEVGQLLQAIKLLQARLHTVFGQFSETAAELSSASEQITGSGKQTLQRMQQQQDETGQLAAAMSQMAAAISEVARNTTLAARSAQDAEEESHQGHRIVNVARAGINSLAAEVERSSEAIGHLQQSSDQIGGIIEVISGIAEQTNLLALNAAIEAARAGESGRGFAVVADEVRTLAGRTQEATAEIRSMLESLHQGIAQAANVMDAGQKQAVSAVEQSHQTEESLKEITQAIATISQMSQQNAAVAEEQSGVVGTVSQNVNAIRDFTAATAGQAQDSLDAGVRLMQTAQKLREMVQQYTLR